MLLYGAMFHMTNPAPVTGQFDKELVMLDDVEAYALVAVSVLRSAPLLIDAADEPKMPF